MENAWREGRKGGRVKGREGRREERKHRGEKKVRYKRKEKTSLESVYLYLEIIKEAIL